MIFFYDFPPMMVESGVFIPNRFESLRDVMPRVNHWIEQNRVRVINIETILFPGVHDAMVIADATSVIAGGEFASNWTQIIRVWYEK